jgi:deoxyribodipyrimidine photo-lyase
MNIYLFQRDLRVNDQPLLKKAVENGNIIGLYVFQNNIDETDSYGIVKSGKFQRAFIYESLIDLKSSLKKLNVPLLILKGDIPEILKQLNEQHPIDTVFHEVLLGSEERRLYESIAFKTQTLEMKPLYDINTLPFIIDDLPNIFTHFRKLVEESAIVRKLELAIIPQKPFGGKLNVKETNKDELGINNINSTFPGGEHAGIKRLYEYTFNNRFIDTYFETRNNLMGHSFSSKLSPYLAYGCISAQTIYYSLKYYEQTINKNKSTYWLYFELLWRDFFHFTHKKHGDKVFSKNGLKQYSNINEDLKKVKAFLTASTGYPLIDAAIKELKSTGFMSNRARQNVANFFTKQLKQDHRVGAAFFESFLVDYDVSSNILNWLYAAGLGNDPREDRIFNVTGQGLRYDKDGIYIKKYLPTLNHLSAYEAYMLPFNGNENLDFPSPIIKLKRPPIKKV